MDHEKLLWRRNQMEASLWRYVVSAPNWGADTNGLAYSVPQVFRSRIQKLLNLDRLARRPSPSSRVDEAWAFYDQPGGGPGSEDRFSTGHVFLMGIGLELMDLGLKQSDVVFFLQHARPSLDGAFDQIHQRGGRAPVTGSGRRNRSFVHHQNTSESIRISGKPVPIADFTAWMVVQRREAKEMFPIFQDKTKGRLIPLFFEPEFFFGFEQVKDSVFGNLAKHRCLALIEIADLALTIPNYLAATPVVKRGRPRGPNQPAPGNADAADTRRPSPKQTRTRRAKRNR